MLKAVISYNDDCKKDRKYNINLIYNDLSEAVNVAHWIYQFEHRENINILKNNNIVRNICVSMELLNDIIEYLVRDFNSEIIVGNCKIEDCYKFNINNYMDRLHTSATLKLGNYFSFEGVYYISFDYVNDYDKDKLLYYFNSELSNMMSNLNMWPYIVCNKDKNKKNNNKNYVMGTNIPKELLPYFIKMFIEEYQMIINIGDYKLKDKFNNEELLECLSLLESNNLDSNNKCKIKTIKKQNTL